MPPPNVIAYRGELPNAANPQNAQRGIERLRQAVIDLDDAGLTSRLDTALASSEQSQSINAIFGNSPYLTQCAVLDPESFLQNFERGPASVIDTCFADLVAPDLLTATEEYTAKSLRMIKRRAALAIAMADITGHWSAAEVTGHLSELAEKSIGAAIRFLLLKYHRTGAFVLADETSPETGSGLIVLGMGKLGARELNYSSDVDLMVFFDSDVITTDRDDQLQRQLVRLTRDMVKMLSERTPDGYVFRTDLRLRPDPGSTPLAMSVIAAETYYESTGQNWERAAMIKARQVAGDRQAGDQYLDRLQPFIWRKNLDFAAIEDIHSIKRQINSHRGSDSIAVEGHNVKLGRGGIREIEFFAQTQQLIWGGRDPTLREPTTCGALSRLADAGHIEPPVVDELTEAYWYLRTVEHRLQMVDDQQTHNLPGDEDSVAEFAVFMGYPKAGDFRDALVGYLKTVEVHYAELFEEAPSLGDTGSVTGNLIFTGSDDDPDTLETLQELGFASPSSIVDMIRGWHRARYRATANERARQILTELVPNLLAVFGQSPDPDIALRRFDGFLAGLPSGVQLFSLFRAHPQLLALMAEVMGSAPKLADHLGRHPGVLDSVLDPEYFGDLPNQASLDRELDITLGQARDFEDVLDRARIWTNDKKLQIGIHALRNLADWDQLGRALSDVAEIAISRLKERVEEEFVERHGRMPGGEWMILGMGKLGGREMTPASDLDLITVYDHHEDATQSDGERPLMVGQYYARMTQRLINAITAPTAQGILYEVDMRLRPSGNAGPIASHVAGFEKYHQESAWTWEHMALARARPIGAGNDDEEGGIADKVRTIIRDTLTGSRDAEKLRQDVADMRRRMDQEHHTTSPWEIKHLRGGLVDVEFISQYLQLRHARENPAVLSQNTGEALTQLTDGGILTDQDGAILRSALSLYQSVQGLLRLTIDGNFEPKSAAEMPKALQIVMSRIGNCDGFDALAECLNVSAGEVMSIYQKTIG